MDVNLIQKRTGKAWLFLLFALTAGGCARAVAPASRASPYAEIFQRNVFDLHAAVVPRVVAPKPPALPKITLTGITTILGKKIAFITVNSVRPGKPQYIALAEGQTQDDVEVKRIDDRAGMVEVINHGEPQALDFEHGGAPTAAPR